MKKFASISLALLLSLALVPTTSQTVDAQDQITGELTGNIALKSKYIFRGYVESDRPAVQGGVDYSHPSGLYVGYWGSTLGPANMGGYTKPDGQNTSTENDFYAGYAGSAGPLSYDLGVTQFTYLNEAGGADMTEAGLSLGYGPVSLSTNYALNDGFQVEGDMYTSLSASKTVLGDLGLNAKVGFFTADQGGTNDGLEDIVVGVSHPIGDSGADWSLQYVHADPELNPGTDNQVVMGLSYGFGIAE